MLVINNIEVTKTDIESILRNIQFMQKKYEEGKLEEIKWTLDVLESHLSENLKEDGEIVEGVTVEEREDSVSVKVVD